MRKDFCVIRGLCIWVVWFLLCILVVSFLLGTWNAEPEHKSGSGYSGYANASEQISEGLVVAKTENKLLLLQFGANWCGWCFKLQKKLETDKAVRDVIKSHYIVVPIDAESLDNAEIDVRYGTPTRYGLPVIVICDANGKMIAMERSSDLTSDGDYDSDKVLSFLVAIQQSTPQQASTDLPQRRIEK